ncbi:MAG: guanylate kinase [Planctomycetes bacterium]|nr:guanylate kinase [Planctomycetota bacterium]
MAQSAQQLPGILVVLSGPAGVGKTTVAARLLENDGYVRSVSATTRAPRAGEVNGRDYHYVSREEFKALIEQDDLIEHAEVHGNFYGTPMQPLREALAQNKVMLLVIDVNGGVQVKSKKLEALLLFLKAPSQTELTRRLEKRATESPVEQAKRLAKAMDELKVAEANYDRVLVNDDLDRCVAALAAAIDTKRRELLARRDKGETLYPGLTRAN